MNTAHAIATLIRGALHGDGAVQLTRVVTDTRGGLQAGDLFVGLLGPHFDGSSFAEQALAEGASAVLITGSPPPLPAGAAAVVVPDTLAALQALATDARSRFTGEVLAITGSNGKTITKDLLVAALSTSRAVAASPMSYNSQVGVAISLLQLDPDAELWVVECGISEVGETSVLEAMVRPDLGILTNIGDAHLEGLGSRERTAAEKALLFARTPGWVLVPKGEPLGRLALEAVGAGVEVVGGAGCGLALPSAPAGPWQLTCDGSTVALNLVGTSPVLAADVVLAARAARLLGASPDQVAAGLDGWRPAPMRLEMSVTPRGILLLNDAYSADPVSAEAALRALVRERTEGRAIAVLGGMAQLGAAAAGAHVRVGRRAAELGVDILVGVGAGGADIARAARDAGGRCTIHTVADVRAASRLLDEEVRAGDRVLLKASRPERLERLAAVFMESLAPARLYVDLDQLVGNARALRRTAGGTPLMAVLKSFGYGLGGPRVALTLQRAGVEAFAVAYPDEGVALRARGVTRPVLVQNVVEHEATKVVRHALSAQVSSQAMVGWLDAEAARQRRPLRVHVKVDTGMGRAGVPPARAVSLCRTVRAAPWLRLDGLMTHFAVADDPTQDAFTRAQIARFQAVVDALGDDAPRWIHASNSAGIGRFPDARFTLVRAGLGLLGYARGLRLGTSPVLRLVTHVVTMKDVGPEQTVGYGRTWSTGATSRRIAVVALGYNDGYPWSLSNRAWMSVRGARCPVVGRVCMDVTMLDVTDAPGVAPGDEVVVFGPSPDEPDLEDLATLAGTIPYELLTRLSARIRRIFRATW